MLNTTMPTVYDRIFQRIVGQSWYRSFLYVQVLGTPLLRYLGYYGETSENDDFDFGVVCPGYEEEDYCNGWEDCDENPDVCSCDEAQALCNEQQWMDWEEYWANYQDSWENQIQNYDSERYWYNDRGYG